MAPNFKCTTSGGDSEEPDIGILLKIETYNPKLNHYSNGLDIISK